MKIIIIIGMCMLIILLIIPSISAVKYSVEYDEMYILDIQDTTQEGDWIEINLPSVIRWFKIMFDIDISLYDYPKFRISSKGELSIWSFRTSEEIIRKPFLNITYEELIGNEYNRWGEKKCTVVMYSNGTTVYTPKNCRYIKT